MEMVKLRSVFERKDAAAFQRKHHGIQRAAA